ncbi:sodium-coupled monocarboxylate transporter 1-like [Periplaneta americana]|uniref:sodium-coupled monocarboxylate transporter 1-like n=1 Tax=Periplaneta americana TaxID=6978 RepID=UPI0037E7E2D9
MTSNMTSEGTSSHSFYVLFGWLDFTLFLTMLAISTLIGIYFGFWGKKEETPKEYLHGGKTMSALPVAVSLVTSHISGITVMGSPSEIFRYGTLYWFFSLTLITVAFINYYYYLPVFYELQLTSTYEYLEKRFNHRVRVMASVLYTIYLLLYVPIVVYAPALVLSQVSGVNLHYITMGTSILCIFYTMLGGLKAVVWTDFLQGIVMMSSSLTVMVLGIMYAGGMGTVLERNIDGGRFRFQFGLSPLERMSLCTVIIGGTAQRMGTAGVNQAIVQKFMALPTYAKAKQALIMFAIGVIAIEAVSCFTGIVIYAIYYDCDPLAAQIITKPDQLATLYVMEVAGSVPGLPGLFVAGIFSAALSTMSSSLNSLGATLFEDFVKPCFKTNLSDATTNKIIKCVVIGIGGACLCVVLLVDKLGSILQLTFVVGGVTTGAMLGLFTFGIFIPRGNSKGALAGSICSLLYMSWIVVGSQWAMSDGRIQMPVLPTSVEGCDFNVTIPEPPPRPEGADEGVFVLFRVSFVYYTFMGILVVVGVGTIVSLLTEAPGLDKMNPAFFSPIVRRYVKKHKKAADEMAEAKLMHMY